MSSSRPWYDSYLSELERRTLQTSERAARARRRINGSRKNAESISKAGVVNAPEAKKETKTKLKNAFGKSGR